MFSRASISFRRGDETINLGPGGFVFLPRGVPHAHRRIGDDAGKLLILITPAGFETFFVELSEAMASGWSLDEEFYGELSCKYAMTWLDQRARAAGPDLMSDRLRPAAAWQGPCGTCVVSVVPISTTTPRSASMSTSAGPVTRPWGKRRGSAPDQWYDLLGEAPSRSSSPGSWVIEVQDKAVGARVDVLA
jgi:hypothetical protein